MDKISFNFKNRTALITGGAQGFGLDIAKRFLASGARVIIWDIDSKMLEKAVKDLDINYVSIIAIKGAYQLIDIAIKYNNNEHINVINKFISLIDDNLDNYTGNKNELLYLTSILSLNDDSSYKNNSDLLSLYENIINNDNISSTIKERVRKIHEYYIFT